MDWARRAQRGKRSAAARAGLGVGGAVEQREELEDFLGFEAGASMWSFCTESSVSGRPLKSMRNAPAARGGTSGGAEVFDGFAGFGEVFRPGGRGPCAVHLFKLAAAERAGDVAAQELAEGFEFEDFELVFILEQETDDKKTIVCPTFQLLLVLAAVLEGFFDYA